MKVLEIDAESGRYGHMTTSNLQIRMAASGSHFTWWRTGSSPSGIGLSRIGDGKIEHKYSHSGNGGFVVTSDDGFTIYTSSGIFGVEDLTMTGVNRRRNQEDSSAVLPLVGGPFYLSFQGGGNMGGGGAESEVRGTLCLMGNRQKIVTLDFPVLDRWGQHQWQAGEMTHDRRIWIFPRAKLFVGIPTTNDRLVCRRLDVDQMLDRAGIDYMFVASMPPTGAQVGKEWVYPVAVKSRKGGVKIKVETAPDGMKKDRDETMRWVPKEAGTFTVVLLVSDASGQEVYHSFKVVVK